MKDRQEKVEDKKVYSIWRERKCRAEENKGTLLKVAGRGGGFGKSSIRRILQVSKIF